METSETIVQQYNSVKIADVKKATIKCGQLKEFDGKKRNRDRRVIGGRKKEL